MENAIGNFDLYYEYRCDGILHQCFKDKQKAIKHCRYEFNRYPDKTHEVIEAIITRKSICCLIP